jgi:hypothetical protein
LVYAVLLVPVIPVENLGSFAVSSDPHLNEGKISHRDHRAHRVSKPGMLKEGRVQIDVAERQARIAAGGL